MIQIKCKSVKDTLLFTELLPFQGNLKKRTDEDIKKLAASLLEDGLIQPLSVWHTPEGLFYILDGHARHRAIQYIAETQPDVLKQSFPVILIEANSIEDACNLLLQTSSAYGKITPVGLTEFLKKAPNIKVEKLGIRVKPLSIKAPIKIDTEITHKIVKLKVPKEVVAEFIDLVSKLKGVEIL